MSNYYGCKNRNTYKCGECVGWNKYESNTLINPVLAMDINREMRMLHKAALNGLFGFKNAERKIDMKIKKVIFNAPATVVLWEDGTKTIVKAGEGDIYDPEKGLAMAIAKKALGNQGNYYEVFKKWLPDEGFKYLCNRIKLNQAIDECFGCPEDTVGIMITSDDILFEQSDGSKIGFKDIASKFTGDKKEITGESIEPVCQSLPLRDYCALKNLTKNKVYGMIERGEIKAHKNERGYWLIDICE